MAIIELFTRVIKTEVTILDEESQGKCTTTDNGYPNNLTLANLVDWTCLPTLVYEIEYPRQERINWRYIAEKSAATFGVIWIMIIISEAYLYPVVIETVHQKEVGMALDQRWNFDRVKGSGRSFQSLYQSTQLLTFHSMTDSIRSSSLLPVDTEPALALLFSELEGSLNGTIGVVVLFAEVS
ncbi:hypothetical protein K469DRAFT_751290 [Zopfia rhizophila CBS 207.26]|uniref:Uncharacterized protein n=1 Tax=Zopfia rhizophila CBS 207.26 TaxID=1314779 RepID=A0A6A6DW50_9PEZI|nr:hypothetical protein K469DRAFT_751290 [Zopfia rhizophila CBS 207.26]